MKKNRGERKLLLGFGAFLILTISIGFVGIFQIQSLTKAIRELGKRHLPMERVILEMKISNALYAMGVRNYAFWRTSQYLQAASIASDVKFIEQSTQDFKGSLSTYTNLVYSKKQREWANWLEDSADKLESIGREVMQLADVESPDKERIHRLLMDFETRFYQIDDFLVESLSKSNLEEIDKQLKLTDQKRTASLIILIFSLLSSFGLGTAIAYFVSKSLREERQTRERLVQRMISIEEKERENLSRQIHDQLSQDLSALRIYLGLMDQDIPSELKETREKIEKSKWILADLVKRSHNISELLRPSELDNLGLVESIGALILEHKELTGYRYRYEKPSCEIILPGEYSLALYRVVQEALTNIAKYSQAKNVEISLDKSDETIRLAVTDDGVGFDYDALLMKPRRRKDDQIKLGLQGLRERMELLGGKFMVETAPGQGTKIKAELSI